MNQLKTILLLGARSALVVAGGAAMGPQWTWPAVALALGMNLFAWFFSDRLVLRMSGAREVCEQYGVAPLGRVEEVRERFFALTVERRLRHPAAAALAEAARAGGKHR